MKVNALYFVPVFELIRIFVSARSYAAIFAALFYFSGSNYLFAAENALSLAPFQGSVSASNYIHTTEFTDRHVLEVQQDPLLFVRETLIPSIEDSQIAQSAILNWQLNPEATVTNESENGLTWFYIDLVNNSPSAIETLIEFTDFDGVGWVFEDESGEYQFFLPDYGSYLGGRPIFDTQTVVPRTVPANQATRFIGFFYSVSVPRVSQILLWEPESFREQRAKRHFGDGAYYGFLLALVLYNLALFALMRQASYLYAGMFQLCVGTIVFIGTGYSTIFLFANSLNFTVPAYGLVFVLAGIFGALFSISILQIRVNHLLLYRLWMATIIWSSIQIPIIVYSAIPIEVEVNSISFIVLVNSVVFLASQALHIYTLVYFWNRTDITKAWFVAVTLQVWILVVWQLAGAIGYGIVDVLRYLVQFFTVINGIVLTWIIGNSVQLEQRQRTIAQDEALTNLQIANAIQQSKSNFISTAGHDLRQPLEAMRLHITSIKNETSSKTREVLRKVENNIKELSSLLTSLMNLSKSTTYVDSSTSEVFSLNEVLRNLEEEVDPFVKQKNLKLLIQNAPYYVQSSKVGVTQIIRNILNNSIRYTKSGSITVAIEDLSSSVLISVNDTGPGIPEDELENVFAEYYQLSGNDSDPLTGMGLGLSIVDRLAKSLEIPLNISSELGKGTEFSLKLPKLDPKLLAATRTGKASSLNGFQIVVLHSNPTSSSQLKNLLEQWGAMAMGWSDVTTAESYISSHAWQPDMIVASQDIYENFLAVKSRIGSGKQLSKNSSYRHESTLGILGRDISNLPVLVLHNADQNDAASVASLDKAKNPKHHWFKDPINPSVLRSFIQRLVVGPSN